MELEDLEPFSFPMPPEWTDLLRQMEGAGGNIHLREAHAARLRIATAAHSNSVALYVAHRHLEAARLADLAADKRQSAANKIARSLTLATWVLAAATAALIVVTASVGAN